MVNGEKECWVRRISSIHTVIRCNFTHISAKRDDKVKNQGLHFVLSHHIFISWIKKSDLLYNVVIEGITGPLTYNYHGLCQKWIAIVDSEKNLIPHFEAD